MATIKPDFAKLLPPHLQLTLGPILSGLFIDGVDLATLGPVGLILGPFVGGVAGWWLAGQYGMGSKGKFVLTALTALYCFAPMTELIPLATLVSLLIPLSAKRDHKDSTKPERIVDTTVVSMDISGEGDIRQTTSQSEESR